MSDCQTEQLMDDFKNERIAPESFSHIQHIETAYALLRHKPFLEAVTLYANGLRKLALAGGAPKKFNMTITLAYLGLIAERIEADQSKNRDQFIADNSDLLDKEFLLQWYDPKRLWSDSARKSFLMPVAGLCAK